MPIYFIFFIFNADFVSLLRRANNYVKKQLQHIFFTSQFFIKKKKMINKYNLKKYKEKKKKR